MYTFHLQIIETIAKTVAQRHIPKTGVEYSVCALHLQKVHFSSFEISFFLTSCLVITRLALIFRSISVSMITFQGHNKVKQLVKFKVEYFGKCLPIQFKRQYPHLTRQFHMPERYTDTGIIQTEFV